MTDLSKSAKRLILAMQKTAEGVVCEVTRRKIHGLTYTNYFSKPTFKGEKLSPTIVRNLFGEYLTWGGQQREKGKAIKQLYKLSSKAYKIK